jgi:phosphatidate cytidylyltransferase
VLQRILTTVVLWLTFIGLLWWLGRPAAVGIATVMAVLTQHEFYGMLIRIGHRPFQKLGLVLGAMMILGPYAARTLPHLPNLPPWLHGLFLRFGDSPQLMGSLVALAVIICSLRILYERDPAERVDTLAATLFGIVYVPFMLHFLVEIFFLPVAPIVGLMLVVWLVAVVKFCDVGALLVGTAFGRHKLAPSISPKKTWEGLVGGVLCSALVGAGLVAALPQFYPPVFTPWISIAAAVPIALLAVVSDLVESMLKRRADLKDSGRSVPGIGGAFDLTDSVILTAPAAYLIFAGLLWQP